MLIDQYVDGVYDPADILAMSLALERVCNALEIRPSDCRSRNVIAGRIIELVRRGEHSPARLCDRLLREANAM